MLLGRSCRFWWRASLSSNTFSKQLCISPSRQLLSNRGLLHLQPAPAAQLDKEIQSRDKILEKANIKVPLEIGSVTLRDYQKEMIEEFLDNLKAGMTRQLLTLPTGSGKTVVFLAIARLLNLKTLIIANSVELIEQTNEKLQEMWPGVWSGILRSKSNMHDRQVVIATVQTASSPKRLQALCTEDFELLIVDEAHHSTANTYVTIMLNLGFLSLEDAMLTTGKRWAQTDGSAQPSDSSDSEQDGQAPTGRGLWQLGADVDEGEGPTRTEGSSGGGGAGSVPSSAKRRSSDSDSVDLAQSKASSSSSSSSSRAERGSKIILGCTATPYRRGPDRLKLVYDTLVQTMTLGDLIEQGYLCKVYAERILTYTDISRAVNADGSLTSSDAELSLAIDTPERNKLVVTAYLNRAAGRKAVAFCCTVEHATNLAHAFREQGVTCEVVSSHLHKNTREQLLEAHKRGDIQVLTNVGILTEGYDDTSISCILMTKPTTSTGLYTQCVGRGLRTHPGKENCILLDFTDRLHSLDRESDLVTSEDVFAGQKGVVLRNYNPNAQEEMALELSNIMGGTFDIYQQRTYLWVQHFQNFWMSIMPEGANPYRRKTEGTPKGSVWIHLREVPAPAPAAKRQRRCRRYQLCISWPSFSPPIGTRSGWRVLAEFDGPLSAPAERFLKQAEKALRDLSKAKEVPSLESMKMRKRNAELGWMAEPATEKQLSLLVAKQWLPAGSNPTHLTKGQAMAIITLFKVEEATHRAAKAAHEAPDGPSLPATDKQKAYLEALVARHGNMPALQEILAEAGLPRLLPYNIGSLSKDVAGRAISVIKLHAK